MNNETTHIMQGFERSRALSLMFEACLNAAMKDGFDDTTEDGIKLLLVNVGKRCYDSEIPEEEAIKWAMIHLMDLQRKEDIESTIHNTYSLRTGKYGKGVGFPREQQLAYQTEEFLNRRYVFRYNTMRMGNECRELRSAKLDFQPLTERMINGMAIRAHKEGIPVWDKDINRFLKSDFIKSFSPLEDYLSHLPKWDGRDRIHALAATIPTRHPLWENLFYIWFLSMVAHWREDNQKYANSISPLLIGPQGCGKSTWCANLLPPQLRDYYTDSLDLSSKRKAELCLTRFGLINFDEFDSISLNQQAYLKHILQKAVVKTAAPYQSTVQSMRRYASFIGTSNNADLLNDPTGSRRFICVEIEDTIKTEKPINYEQLYAQAVHALVNEEKYWFTPEEEKLTMEQNESFHKQDVEEQLFLQYFDTPRMNEPGEWMLAVQIFSTLRSLSKMNLGNKRCNMFGRILKKHCKATKQCSQGILYWVQEREK